MASTCVEGGRCVTWNETTCEAERAVNCQAESQNYHITQTVTTAQKVELVEHRSPLCVERQLEADTLGVRSVSYSGEVPENEICVHCKLSSRNPCKGNRENRHSVSCSQRLDWNLSGR